MKMIHVIAMFLVIIGGIHFALTGIGIDLFGAIFGGANLMILYIAIGVSTLYFAIPVFRAKISAL